MSADRPIEEMTLRQLRRVASELAVSRYSRMRKDQLLDAIRAAQRLRVSTSPSRILETRTLEAQSEVEVAKFAGLAERPSTTLAVVDEDLSELPSGYGDSRIVLMPRDPQWAYAYWDIPNECKEYLRRQGGVRLALRFYDVTDIGDSQRPHSLQQYECDELAREWYLPVPVSDREYAIEIGYIAMDGRWLLLARSAAVRIPPVYPSDWVDDQFVTIDWDENLRDKIVLKLDHPARKFAEVKAPVYEAVFAMAQAAEAQRVPASASTAKAELPEQSVSSYVLPSGLGNWAGKTDSGVGMSGVGMSGVGMAASRSGAGLMSGTGLSTRTESGAGMSGAGLSARTESGAGMSGIGAYTSSGMGMSGSGAGLSARTESGVGMALSVSLYSSSGAGMSGAGLYGTSGVGMSGMGMSGMGMSGVGFSASMPPIRPRQFWLVADAELIVYGATEPDATVTIGGRPIQLSSDGTFRFQMSFQDGLIDFPILAVAADGEQIRSLHMKFSRETPERQTNTKAEAVLEWLP